MNIEVEIWSNLKCVSGSTRLAVVDRLADIDAGLSLDNDDSLNIVVPRESDWLATTKLRQVLRVTDRFGRVSEWRIRKIDDRRQAGAGSLVTITGKPVINDLGAHGLIWRSDISTRRGYNLGGENLTIAQYIETFILPFLTDESITHFALGTMDFDDPELHRFSVAWQPWTPLQLLQELTKLAGGELNIRRNGDTNYLIDVVVARNFSMPQVLLRADKNVTFAERNRISDSLKTVIVPFGMIPDGDYEQATLGYNDWVITAISSNTLTLDGMPIQYDDQLNNLYVLKPDATRTQITDTILSTQQIVVSSASGLAVNDHIQIVKDSDGNLLTELTNPSAVAMFGRVVGTFNDPNARGERNHVPNSFGNLWTVGNQAVNYGRVNGTQIGVTTINLDELPVGLVVAVGDLLHVPANVPVNVTTGGTVNGSGQVTLTVGTSINGSDNVPIRINQIPAVPTGWQKSDTNANPLFHKRMDPSLTGDLTGAAINGAHSDSGGAIIDGLTAGAIIQAGDIVEIGATPARHIARGPATADGGGVARVALHPAVTASDNDAVNVRRPNMARQASGTNAVFLPITSGGNYIRTPDYTIMADDETPLIWCSVGFDYFSPVAQSTSAGASPIRPKLEIWNSTGPTLMETIEDVNRTFAVLEEVPVTLIRSVLLSANTTVHLRFFPITNEIFGQAGLGLRPHTYLRYFQIHIGSDPRAPATPDSNANRLWKLTNNKLAEVSEEPFTAQARVIDLAALNEDLDADELALGQTVRVQISGMAGNATVDVIARITGLHWFLDPLNTQLTIETIPPRITKSLTSPPLKQLFLTLNVGDDPATTPAGTTPATDFRIGTVSDRLPTRFRGSLRAIIPAGQGGSAPVGGGIIIGHVPKDLTET